MYNKELDYLEFEFELAEQDLYDHDGSEIDAEDRIEFIKNQIRNIKMGKPELDSRITGSMGSWGGNYDSTTGCNHNKVADKHDASIESKDVTLNKMSKMDASHAKPSSDNPGVDTGFLAKAKPSTDSTGHGKLARSCKD